MDFRLSEEQALLQQSVGRFIDETYTFTRRRAWLDGAEGFQRDNWAFMADQGWLAMPFAEADGGLGCGAVETMILMEAFGRGLVVEPYLACILLAGGVLARGAPETRARYLPDLMSGATVFALAHHEPPLHHGGVAPATRIQAGRLTGVKELVVHGGQADHLVVSGRAEQDNGVGLVVVDGGASGIHRSGYRTVDGLPAARIEFLDAPIASILATPEHGAQVLEDVLTAAAAALMAEAVGAMQALFDATLDYVKTRHQFGRALGSFQVVQHRLADMMMALEQARGMMLLATLSLDRPRPERQRNVSAAQVAVARHARAVGHDAIQLHGGIGMSHELNIGHYHKRLMMITTLLGDERHHLKRYGRLRRAEPDDSVTLAI